MKIIIEILTAVAVACIPIITGYILEALAKITEKISAEIENKVLADVLMEVSEAVQKAVAATNQTYVDSIKKSGNVLSKEAQEEALTKATDYALLSLSASTKDFIEEHYGGLIKYLQSQIEAEVRYQKEGINENILIDPGE